MHVSCACACLLSPYFSLATGILSARSRAYLSRCLGSHLTSSLFSPVSLLAFLSLSALSFPFCNTPLAFSMHWAPLLGYIHQMDCWDWHWSVSLFPTFLPTMFLIILFFLTHYITHSSPSTRENYGPSNPYGQVGQVVVGTGNLWPG